MDEIVYAAAGFGNGGGPFDGTSVTVLSAMTLRNGARVWQRNMENLNQTFAVAGTTALLSVYPNPAADGIDTSTPAANSQTELRALDLSNGLSTWQVASAGWSLTASPMLAGGWVCARLHQRKYPRRRPAHWRDQMEPADARSIRARSPEGNGFRGRSRRSGRQRRHQPRGNPIRGTRLTPPPARPELNLPSRWSRSEPRTALSAGAVHTPTADRHQPCCYCSVHAGVYTYRER